MFSIYVSAFNLIKHNFPWQESAENFVKFAGEEGEVVFAINQSEDNTLEILKEFAAKNKNVKIVETNFRYDDIEFDGKIKNAALQATTKPIKIQMDLDEIFVYSQREKWVQYANDLLNSPIECLMIPTLDLFGSRDKIRSNSQIGLKFRMHKAGLKRGVWKEAWRGDKIDTSKSDTCEALRSDGNLAISSSIVNYTLLNPFFASQLKDYIYTVHLGYLSFEHRININKSLWARHWELRSGHEENVALNKSELENEMTIFHNLSID